MLDLGAEVVFSRLNLFEFEDDVNFVLDTDFFSNVDFDFSSDNSGFDSNAALLVLARVSFDLDSGDVVFLQLELNNFEVEVDFFPNFGFDFRSDNSEFGSNSELDIGFNKFFDLEFCNPDLELDNCDLPVVDFLWKFVCFAGTSSMRTSPPTREGGMSSAFEGAIFSRTFFRVCFFNCGPFTWSGESSRTLSGT